MQSVIDYLQKKKLYGETPDFKTTTVLLGGNNLKD